MNILHHSTGRATPGIMNLFKFMLSFCYEQKLEIAGNNSTVLTKIIAERVRNQISFFKKKKRNTLSLIYLIKKMKMNSNNCN